MTPTRRRFIGTVTATSVVGLAGCLGDGGDEETPAGAATGTPTETDAGTETGTTEATGETTDAGDETGATVAVESNDEHGEILVDSDGLTLYMFDSDEQGAGESTCSGGCLEAWPPLTTRGEPAAGDGVTAELTTFDRDDGETQVAANGWPLYYFASDEEPGDVRGQGVNDVWWVLDAGGEPMRPSDGADGEEDTDESSGGGY